MSNYQTLHIDIGAARAELHDALALTATEVSLNNLPAGCSIPFVHAHTHTMRSSILCWQAGVYFLWTERNLAFLKATASELILKPSVA